MFTKEQAHELLEHDLKLFCEDMHEKIDTFFENGMDYDSRLRTGVSVDNYTVGNVLRLDGYYLLSANVTLELARTCQPELYLLHLERLAEKEQEQKPPTKTKETK